MLLQGPGPCLARCSRFPPCTSLRRSDGLISTDWHFWSFQGTLKEARRVGRGMLTTFSHKPFQPPHFSVCSGMSPNIWDFNVIKSNWTQKNPEEHQKSHKRSFPSHPSPKPRGMGCREHMVVAWGGCLYPHHHPTPSGRPGRVCTMFIMNSFR